MKRVVVGTAVVMIMSLVMLSVSHDASGQQDARSLEQLRSEYADVFALQGTSRQEILAIARLLRARPEMAIDQTRASGELCLNSGLGTMTHYATDPSATREDIVYEFDAGGLTSAGLDPTRLPPLPALGKMEPGRWYHLTKGLVDPHHQHPMSGETLLIAVDVR